MRKKKSSGCGCLGIGIGIGGLLIILACAGLFLMSGGNGGIGQSKAFSKAEAYLNQHSTRKPHLIMPSDFADLGNGEYQVSGEVYFTRDSEPMNFVVILTYDGKVWKGRGGNAPKSEAKVIK